jgi:hypothetical protein
MKGQLPHSPTPDPAVLPHERPKGFVCKRCGAPLTCRKRGLWLIWTSETDDEDCPRPFGSDSSGNVSASASREPWEDAWHGQVRAYLHQKVRL